MEKVERKTPLIGGAGPTRAEKVLIHDQQMVKVEEEEAELK